MLLSHQTLEGIASGAITLLFRRWERPRVKPGSSFRTQVGVIGVNTVDQISDRLLTDRVARQAGFESREALLAELAKYPGGQLYRIGVHLAGVDPRVALRGNTLLSDDEVRQLEHQLGSMGARSKDGPWAIAVLRLIEQRPGVLAARLAKSMGMETVIFKPRVRQLKELGLTESLEIGYRLSPRGAALLRRLEARRKGRTG